MTILIVGASGATGKHLVGHLLSQGHRVKAIVRSPEKLPKSWQTHEGLTIIHNSVLNISVDEMAEYVKDCDAVASCLGHNLTLKGMYGKPRKLVRDAVMQLCSVIQKNALDRPTKFLLMNTSGNVNRDLKEEISMAQKIVLGLIRVLIPPHSDNEQAADYLRTNIGQQNQFVEWVVVRPDTLVNEDEVSPYEIHPSPIRSALFDPGKVSRINVGHFMAQLIVDQELWNKWKGQMPVIYGHFEASNS